MYVLRKRNGQWFVRQADNGAGSGGGQAAQGGHGQETGPSGETGQQQRNGDAPPASWDEVFQHERFKQLVKRAKEAETALEKLARSQEEAEQAKLKEQQRFQELFEKEQQRAAALAGELEQARRDAANERRRRAVEDAARAHEPRFLPDALKDLALFIDLDALEIGEDGTVKGVEAAVKNLAKERPYMLESKRQDPGSPPGPKPAGTARPAEPAVRLTL